MHRRKVLIADPSEEFQSALIQELEPWFQVACTGRGQEALQLARLWEPDVLVLETCLQGLDGLTVLRELMCQAHQPQVLAFVPTDNPMLLIALENLQVSHAMRKPAPAHKVAERVRELAGASGQMTRSQAARILTGLGLPSGRQGFQHLLTGLPALVEQRDQRLSKELYVTIAREDRTSEGGVEKAIRDTIRASWETGDREAWQRCFPGITRCPRNKEFLFRIADLLSQELRCG